MIFLILPIPEFPAPWEYCLNLVPLSTHPHVSLTAIFKDAVMKILSLGRGQSHFVNSFFFNSSPPIGVKNKKNSKQPCKYIILFSNQLILRLKQIV